MAVDRNPLRIRKAGRQTSQAKIGTHRHAEVVTRPAEHDRDIGGEDEWTADQAQDSYGAGDELGALQRVGHHHGVQTADQPGTDGVGPGVDGHERLGDGRESSSVAQDVSGAVQNRFGTGLLATIGVAWVMKTTRQWRSPASLSGLKAPAGWVSVLGLAVADVMSDSFFVSAIRGC